MSKLPRILLAVRNEQLGVRRGNLGHEVEHDSQRVPASRVGVRVRVRIRVRVKVWVWVRVSAWAYSSMCAR